MVFESRPWYKQRTVLIGAILAVGLIAIGVFNWSHPGVTSLTGRAVADIPNPYDLSADCTSGLADEAREVDQSNNALNKLQHEYNKLADEEARLEYQIEQERQQLAQTESRLKNQKSQCTD